jgi:hypothetical protein
MGNRSISLAVKRDAGEKNPEEDVPVVARHDGVARKPRSRLEGGS